MIQTVKSADAVSVIRLHTSQFFETQNFYLFALFIYLNIQHCKHHGLVILLVTQLTSNMADGIL